MKKGLWNFIDELTCMKEWLGWWCPTSWATLSNNSGQTVTEKHLFNTKAKIAVRKWIVWQVGKLIGQRDLRVRLPTHKCCPNTWKHLEMLSSLTHKRETGRKNPHHDRCSFFALLLCLLVYNIQLPPLLWWIPKYANGKHFFPQNMQNM